MTFKTPILDRAPSLPIINLAETQEEYQALPVIMANSPECIMTARLSLSFQERLRVLITGDIWYQQYTFRRGFSPVKFSTKEPPIHECI